MARKIIVLSSICIAGLFFAYLVYAPNATPEALFSDQFEYEYTLIDAPTERLSASRDWWLSSGGYAIARGGVLSTVQGSLPDADARRLAYQKGNPEDTGNGYYPQNIFRLVQRGRWENFVQEVQFRILTHNLTESPNRNESNGVLLFNRYQDEHTLYYAGLRVDGYAVIKKKYQGTYYTMAYQRVTPGTYDRTRGGSLLPTDTWIGLRSVVVERAGVVHIALYTGSGLNGEWTLVAEAEDDGMTFGNTPIIPPGHAGIRADFMDVEFNAYVVQSTPASTQP